MTDIQKDVVWKRLDIQGQDSCTYRVGKGGASVTGRAEFMHQKERALLEYEVNADVSFAALRGRVEGKIGNESVSWFFEHREDAWLMNGRAYPALKHLATLDLSFTPATNFFQIKRLKREQGVPQPANAAWFNLDRLSFTELQQIYTYRDGNSWWYEAPDEDFRVMLETDGDDVIVRYPELWKEVLSDHS